MNNTSLLLVACNLALVLNGTRSQDIVEARAFVLRDQAGRVRGEFSVDDTGRVALMMLDSVGRRRVVLTLGDAKATLNLADEDGHPRFTAGCEKTGAMVGLMGADQQCRAGLSETNLVFFDDKLKPRAMIGLDDDGEAGLGLSGPNGNEVVKLRAHSVMGGTGAFNTTKGSSGAGTVISSVGLIEVGADGKRKQ